MPISAVVFDAGETLVDETRQWFAWADWLGVTRLTFAAALGAVIERGWHHRRVFDLVAPGLDLARAEAERAAAGQAYAIEPRDLYPDALPALAALKAAGFAVGIAGNQPEGAEAALAACGFAADFIASSARWGVEKPSPAFFARVADAAGRPPGEIAYVGDRLDNDVLPALAVGMAGIFLLRGPWAHIHAGHPEAARASARISGLAALPEVLAALG
jgi:HAD superfamily hydrolase (TIGR01549 family)